MSNIKVTVEKEGNVDVLQVRIPLQAPAPSATGKTLVVAKTGGFYKSDAKVGGKEIGLNLTATVAR